MIVGLTGGIGSGKSTVANIFRSLQIQVCDSDLIARKLIDPKDPIFNQKHFQAIIEHFGPTVLQQDGQIDRAQLRKIIFKSIEERKWLEDLLHPEIKAIIAEKAKSIPRGQYLVAEIPLLVEVQFQDAVDRVLVIDVEEKQQIARTLLRDKNNALDVAAILNAQVSREKRLQAADDVIVNDGGLEELKEKVIRLHEHYKKLSS